jgi:hypothetical protein
MNKNNNKLATRCSDTGLFSEALVELLASYNIHNLEQLLGATEGLLNTSIFDEFEDGTEIVNRIEAYVGNQALEFFRQKQDEYPTGLIIDEDEL